MLAGLPSELCASVLLRQQLAALKKNEGCPFWSVTPFPVASIDVKSSITGAGRLLALARARVL